MNGRHIPLVLVAVAIAVAIGLSIGTTSSHVASSSTNPPVPERAASIRGTTPGNQAWSVEMYWIIGSGLLRDQRVFYGPVDADPVITALEDGPAQGLYVPGLGTAIARNGVVRSVTTAGDRVVVDLDPGFATGMQGHELLGLGQLTLTLTSMPGIHNVEFDVSGANVAVPTSAQAAVTRPVGRADYIDLLAS